MSTQQTVRDILQQVFDAFEQADLFYGHGSDNAWDEAVALVLFVMELPMDSTDDVLALSVSSAQAAHIEALTLRRIETRQPLTYLMQKAWFMGLPFYVDNRVLVPRSPFAELIANHFQPWIVKESVTQILEIGTGSGCIAIAAATQFTGASIDAVDISEGALEVANKNCVDHGLTERVSFLYSDVYSHLDNKRYDIIMSNPPYVSAKEMATLPLEYQQEPQIALEAEQDGLAIVKRILSGALAHLHPGGILVVEVGYTQQALVAHFPDIPFIWLEFEQGGEGIFLLEYDAIKAFQSRLNFNE